MNPLDPAIIFGSFGGGDAAAPVRRGVRRHRQGHVCVADAAIQMAYANQFIVVPGYGLAVTRRPSTPSRRWQPCSGARRRGQYAIHPVAAACPVT